MLWAETPARRSRKVGGGPDQEQGRSGASACAAVSQQEPNLDVEAEC